jgi:hypothetical protein
MNAGVYNGLPGFKEGGTSRDAAISIASTLNQRQQEVLDAFETAGAGGLTADECAVRIGKDEKAVRPRFTELGPKHLNLIEKVPGIRRRNESGMSAQAWRRKS